MKHLIEALSKSMINKLEPHKKTYLLTLNLLQTDPYNIAKNYDIFRTFIRDFDDFESMIRENIDSTGKVRCWVLNDEEVKQYIPSNNKNVFIYVFIKKGMLHASKKDVYEYLKNLIAKYKSRIRLDDEKYFEKLQ